MIWGVRKSPKLGDRRHRNTYAWWPVRLRRGGWAWLEPIVVTYEYSIVDAGEVDYGHGPIPLPASTAWVRLHAEPATI